MQSSYKFICNDGQSIICNSKITLSKYFNYYCDLFIDHPEASEEYIDLPFETLNLLLMCLFDGKYVLSNTKKITGVDYKNIDNLDLFLDKINVKYDNTSIEIIKYIIDNKITFNYRKMSLRLLYYLIKSTIDTSNIKNILDYVNLIIDDLDIDLDFDLNLDLNSDLELNKKFIFIFGKMIEYLPNKDIYLVYKKIKYADYGACKQKILLCLFNSILLTDKVNLSLILHEIIICDYQNNGFVGDKLHNIYVKFMERFIT